MRSLKIILILILLVICYNTSNAQTFSGGTGTAADPYLISTTDDIDTLAARANVGGTWSSGKYFSLTNDIGTTGLGISNIIANFRGNFNGNGYTIKVNYGFTTIRVSIGLFSNTSNAEIYNLIVSGRISVSSPNYDGVVGTIVGSAYGTTRIHNCESQVQINYNGGSSTTINGIVGGIVGECRGKTYITNCSNKGSITFSGFLSHCGGIIGLALIENDTAFVSNCHNDSMIKYTSTDGISSSHTGGIIGCSNAGTFIVDSCYNSGIIRDARTIMGTDDECIFGGIIGFNMGNVKVQDCYNTDSIVSVNCKTTYIGGIVGYNSVYNNLLISNCFNTGCIRASGTYPYVGGILGYAHNNSTVKHCYNRNTIYVTGIELRAGGIVGYNSAYSGATGIHIDTCFNASWIEGTNSNMYGLAHIGGILGDNISGIFYITGCENSGHIYGYGISHHYDLGGIVGDNMGYGTIINCTNIGDISTDTNTAVSSSITLGGIIGYGNNRIIVSHCHNAGWVYGTSNVGGIVGVLNSGGSVSNCLNNGVVSLKTGSAANVGAIIGSKTGTTTISNNFYDKQMTIYGGVNNTTPAGITALFTSELIGTGIQTSLGTTNWQYSTNLYPKLFNDSICKVAAAPAYLYHISATVFNRHNRVARNFTVNTENSIGWDCFPAGNPVVSISGTTATISRVGVGRIEPYIGTSSSNIYYRRTIPITTETPDYSLRTRPDTLANGTTTPDSIAIISGNNYIITATPSYCFEFINWKDSLGNIISTKRIDTIQVFGDTLLIATFQHSYKTLTLRKNPVDGGNVSGDGTKLCGTSDTIKAIPNPCYRFTSWTDSATGSVISNNAILNITVDTNRTLIANFKEIDTFIVKVKAQPVSGGIVTGNDTTTCTDTNVIISATPNDCYTFKHWIDSATGTIISTRRVDTLTAYTHFNTNITLIAIFEIDSILISTTTNPTVAGKTMVNKIAPSLRVECNSDVIISVEPTNDCYIFMNWTDTSGKVISMKKIDTLNFTKDVLLTANFVLDTFNLTLTANPTNYGSVKDAGKFPCGSNVIIEAIPNKCKRFVNWTDAETGAVLPYKKTDTIVLNKNKHFIANFTIDTFNLVLYSSPNNAGILTGAGRYECGHNIMITATPKKDCYVFAYWENLNTEQKYYDSAIYVEMVDNLNYVAHFKASDTFNLVLQTKPSNLNLALLGAGLYSSCDFVAYLDISIFDKCVHFMCWTNAQGDTISDIINPEIILYADSLLIAHFSVDSFNVSLIPNPVDAGLVNNVGYYQNTIQCNSTFIFTAKANVGWKFINWTDTAGNIISTKSTDSLRISNDIKLVANFEESYDSITITLIPTPFDGGTLKGGGKYAVGTKILLTATPNAGYNFISWTENGNVLNKNASFTITASRDMVIRGNFRDAASDVYIVSLHSNIENAGILSGDGVYSLNANVNINAIANDGFYFKHWATENGTIISTAPNYTFKISSDTDLVACFSGDGYNISLYTMPTYMGTIEGGISGLYYKGHTFNLTAIPVDTSIYRFTCWTTYQGNIISKSKYLKLVVASDTNIIANFELKPEGIVENILDNIYVFPNPANNMLNISIDNTFEGDIKIILTDILGIDHIDIFSGIAEVGTNIYKADVSKLQSGMYFLQFYLGDKIIMKKLIVK